VYVQQGVLVSPCTENDLIRVEALWPRRGCGDRFRRQEDEQSAFLLARVPDGVVGRVEIMWTGPRMPCVAAIYPAVPELNGLDVLPQARRRGIGTALLLSAESLARSRGCRAVGLGVGVDNPEAERIYRRLGYVGDLAYADKYVWEDDNGRSHDAADRCRFLTKRLDV